ncbi:hypothetical protein H0H93_011380 [Arthromyces matolae]|nr:hypothetical protein H0H93_011380 [Arthromyces matolae]
MKTTLVLAPAFAVLLCTLLVAASPIPGTSDALVVRSGDGKAPAGSSSNDVTGTIPGDGSHQGTVPPIANRVYQRNPNLHKYLSNKWFEHLIEEDLAEIKYLKGTGHWLDEAQAERMEKELEKKKAWFNSIA